MRYGHLVIGLIAAMLTTGCGSLKKSLENRVSISEECRETLATPPESAVQHTNIASVSIGYVGRCDLTHDESFLAMCSLAQIRTKFGFAHSLDPVSIAPVFHEVAGKINTLNGRLPKPQVPQTELDKATVTFYAAVDDANNAINHPDRLTIWAHVYKLKTALQQLNAKLVDAKASLEVQVASQEAGKAVDHMARSLVSVIGGEAMQADFDAFDQAVYQLREVMIKLAANVRQLDIQYEVLLGNLKDADFTKRTAAMKEANDSAATLKLAVGNVRRAHDATRLAAKNLSASLGQQAAIELAAWDSNLRVQLENFEQMLSGDFSLVFNAGIKNEVLTHVARRSLELLHGALKPADAVINRLDDKAYGAVSVGYLVFGPNLQDAVNTAFDQVSEIYKERSGKGKGAASSMPPKAFVRELKRAACDNLTQGTQFSMLTELVDTMLILKAKEELVDDKPLAPVSEISFAPTGAINYPLPARTDATRYLPLAKARFIQQSAPGGAALLPLPPPPLPGPDITPLSVYATNQWMARQQMLTQKITAVVTTPRTDGSPKQTPFQNIETVDEGLVRQVADVATAKAIDDAARLNPSMLSKSPIDIGPQIQNSINVVTAATAVSQASAALKLNLSISNVNTFSPTNSNSVAPVINVSVPAGTVNAAASPCTAIDFGSIGISCFDHSGNIVLTFASQHFRSDSCMPDDLAPALTAVGNMVKGYRSRFGIGYRATVDGYASLPNSRLARCSGTAQRTRVCNYVNALRQSVPIAGCEDKQTNRNVVLSARRAQVVASALEGAADGAIIIDGLRAFGTETAGKREAGTPDSVDQSVVIRLTPVSRP